MRSMDSGVRSTAQTQSARQAAFPALVDHDHARVVLQNDRRQRGDRPLVHDRQRVTVRAPPHHAGDVHRRGAEGRLSDDGQRVHRSRGVGKRLEGEAQRRPSCRPRSRQGGRRLRTEGRHRPSEHHEVSESMSAPTASTAGSYVDGRRVNVGAALVVFVPGLALGSFLNVVAARVPLRPLDRQPRLRVPDAAGTRSRWYDNVPLASRGSLLRGRCRNCGATIGWLRYPAVELATALLVAGCVWPFGLHAEAAVAAFFCLASSPSRPPTSSTASSRTASSCPPRRSCSPPRRRSDPSPEWAIGAARRRRGFLFAAALAYPARDGDGRREARAAARRELGRTVPVALLSG